MKNRLLVLLLAAALGLSSFAGCTGQGTDPGETGGTLEIRNKPQSAVQVGTQMALDIRYPEGKKLSDVKVTSSDTDIVKVKADKLYFTGEGRAAVTVADKEDQSAADSFEVTVNPMTASDIALNLKSPFAVDYFAPYTATTVTNGVPKELTDNWELDIQNGVLTCVPNPDARKDDIKTVYSLYLKGRVFRNFEIVFQYYKQEKYADGDRGGCAGIMFGKTDRARTSMDINKDADGDLILMSGLGNLALWGPNVGHHMDSGNKAPVSYYRDTEWHLAKFRVYANTIEGYIDDMEIPVIKKTVEGDYPLAGEIALMSNANSTARYKNINIQELTDDGGEKAYRPAKSVGIANKSDFDNVTLSSPAVNISVQTTGEVSQEAAFAYSTSDSSVADVDESGRVSFYGEGEATITVRSLDDLTLTDFVTFTVDKASESVSIVNKPQSAAMAQVFTPVVEDQDGNAMSPSEFTVSSGNAEVAKVTGHKVTFLQPGSVTVTVSKASAPAISDNFTVTVGGVADGERQVYDFRDPSALDRLNCYKVVNNNAAGSGPIEWASAFTLDAATGTLSKTWKTGDKYIPANTYMLAARDAGTGEDVKLSNVEMTLNFKTAEGNLAYTGIAYGVTAHRNRPISGGDGNIAVITSDKTGVNVILDGNETGGLAQAGNKTLLAGFQKEAWHLMRVRIFGDTLEIYVDDMEQPLVTKKLKHAAIAGAFGLYCIDGTAHYRNFSWAPLDENGAYLN